jgi:hypothetical protein
MSTPPPEDPFDPLGDEHAELIRAELEAEAEGEREVRSHAVVRAPHDGADGVELVLFDEEDEDVAEVVVVLDVAAAAALAQQLRTRVGELRRD